MLGFKYFFKQKLKKKSNLVRFVRFLFMLLVLIVFAVYSQLKTLHQEPKLNQLNENSFLYNRTKTEISTTSIDVRNCTKPSILAFPSDGLTRVQRRNGWIIVHITLMFYGFWFLATVCDDYLVPSIKQIFLKSQNDHDDIIGTTIMAAAVSSPKLFVNLIGTFVTKGDIGVSSIVGSAVFNILAAPAFCGLFVVDYLKLDWWPITRDFLLYLIGVLFLVGILRDGQVLWYEALGLTIVYFGYMLAIHFNNKISYWAKKCLIRFGFRKLACKEVNEFSYLLSRNNKQAMSSLTKESYHTFNPAIHSSDILLYIEQQEIEENTASPWSRGQQTLIEFILLWPITFLLWLTVPNCRQRHCWKYVTFLLSMVWVAAISYMMAFVITIIGDTLYIPDAVMGLNVLAAGISIPEAVSSIIVTKHGQGNMGLSKSFGSNTFDILLCLGLPWFLKSFFVPDNPKQYLLALNSASLTYIGILLLISLLGFYLAFLWHNFTLNWRVGVSCMIMYLGFMSIATLIELNVFFPVNLPVCNY